jgi:hypothetical protein
MRTVARIVGPLPSTTSTRPSGTFAAVATPFVKVPKSPAATVEPRLESRKLTDLRERFGIDDPNL